MEDFFPGIPSPSLPVKNKLWDALLSLLGHSLKIQVGGTPTTAEIEITPLMLLHAVRSLYTEWKK